MHQGQTTLRHSPPHTVRRATGSRSTGPAGWPTPPRDDSGTAEHRAARPERTLRPVDGHPHRQLPRARGPHRAGPARPRHPHRPDRTDAAVSDAAGPMTRAPLPVRHPR